MIDEEKKIRENEGIMNWAQILFLGLSTTDGLPLNIFFLRWLVCIVLIFIVRHKPSSIESLIKVIGP